MSRGVIIVDSTYFVANMIGHIGGEEIWCLFFPLRCELFTHETLIQGQLNGSDLLVGRTLTKLIFFFQPRC
jgi:hypothetical protein